MTDRINCPYCTGIMHLLTLGLNEHKHYFYECAECGSRSPMAHNEIMANSMARMRGKPLRTANKPVLSTRRRQQADFPYKLEERQSDGSWDEICACMSQGAVEKEMKRLTEKNGGRYRWIYKEG